MNVLSLFDGMSCGHIALDRAGIKVDKYFASEIKPHAIKVTQHNYPDTIQLGDVRNIDLDSLPKIDLLIGGSPCQDLSIANKQRNGLAGNKSSLFWEYARILKEAKPEFFLLENVNMPTNDHLVITKELGVSPVNINSNLVSAQHRDRWYWTNIQGLDSDLLGNRYIPEPQVKNIKLKDILENGYTDMEKARCLNTKFGSSINNIESTWHRYTTTGMTNVVFLSEDLDYTKGLRFFTQREMEKLQTVPTGYTDILSITQALNVLGDGWTVDVIAHIFSFLPSEWGKR